MATQTHPAAGPQRRGFRIDVATHELLRRSPRPAPLAPLGEPLSLPDPVFPRYPEKSGEVEPDAKFLPKPEVRVGQGRPERGG